MSDRAQSLARRLLWALPIWALMLLLGTLTHQPDPKVDFAGWSAYVTTNTFLASHLINSILGAAIGSVGFVALGLLLSTTPAAGRALAAMIAMIAGNTLTSAIFGIAAFAQPAMGRAFMSGATDMPDFYNDVYAGPLFITAFAGVLLFITGGVLAGLATASSGRFPRWPGWLLGVSVPIFALSNIMLPAATQAPAASVVLVATLAIAWVGWRRD